MFYWFFFWFFHGSLKVMQVFTNPPACLCPFMHLFAFSLHPLKIIKLNDMHKHFLYAVACVHIHFHRTDAITEIIWVANGENCNKKPFLLRNWRKISKVLWNQQSRDLQVVEFSSCRLIQSPVINPWVQADGVTIILHTKQ